MPELLRKDNIGYTEGLYRFLSNPAFPGSMSFAGIQDIPAGGTSTAMDENIAVLTVGADAGGDIVTIGRGTPGQVVYIICADATGTTTITPITFNGGTSITFDALGDSVTLMWAANIGWSIIGGNSYAIV